MASKLRHIASVLFFPLRNVEKLTSSITGVTSPKEYTMMHLPALPIVGGAQAEYVPLRFENHFLAYRVARMLTARLMEAAHEKKSRYHYQGLGLPDRIVFTRDDGGFISMANLYDHLEIVRKNLDKEGHGSILGQIFHERRFPKSDTPENGPLRADLETLELETLS